MLRFYSLFAYRVIVFINGHPLDKQFGHNPYCWLRHLERVSFLSRRKNEDSMAISEDEEIDIPWYQKVIAQSVVILIVVIIFLVGGAIFGQPTQQDVTLLCS